MSHDPNGEFTKRQHVEKRLGNSQITIHDLTKDWVTQRLAELETIKRTAGRSAADPKRDPVEREDLRRVERQADEAIRAVAAMFARKP